VLQCSDGRLGLAEKAPFDTIHVGAHIEKPPKELLDQIKIGGRMFIPAGDPQQIFSIERVDETRYVWDPKEFVQYVPLTSRDAQVRNEG
jgi:protein-L-isoaspartate(D-aspartate) O-methyltransferase